ncbi:MAG TPA: winged helix DNA-binding domain-containing protein [Ktedonobacteraceae bacterium]|nr:winged helix DNA-binding domain-containing protein [Ktedonobacteraceae bacterium]
MTNLDIAHRRLHNQHITRRTLETPQSLVEWLGAVQAQDFAAAKWALGLRLQGVTGDDIEQAFTDGAILRTHVMRPTWHFVSPADIRWLLALTAPRVHAASAYYTRKLELDDAVFRWTNAVLANALQGGKQLTRDELASALQQAGIVTDGEQRITYIVMRAELDGIICSGARRGKQFTYALLAERAPQARMLARDEALAELSMRYFTSHGPATLKDFVWWSGLALADARAGLAMVTSHLLHETIDGQTYWFPPSMPPAQDLSQTACLLPNYDEYTVGYTDRSAIFDALHTNKLDPRSGLLGNAMILNGQVVGSWKRTFEKNTVVIEANPLLPLSNTETRAFAASANLYGAFLRKPVYSPW